jgi:glycosyltransferase involved in cell wall biosynthesis
MKLPSRSVCLYADGAQNPLQLNRGISRYVSEHARALHEHTPSLLHSVRLNPALSLTRNLTPFLGTGLLAWAARDGSVDRGTNEEPLVYHVMSPFELGTPIDVVWPHWAHHQRVATVVTLYDLIPLVFSDHYLQDPAVESLYAARLDLLRHVDGILALSQTTASDAVERIGVASDRVHVIRAGTSEHFAGMYSSPQAAWGQLSRALKAVRPGFLLYVGACDFRKNLEGMIDAFSRLPAALRTQHQLVIVGEASPEQFDVLRRQGDRVGLAPDELVLARHLTDADLGALYHACTLFVFPSFYEGFGLPILEAMSCGAPVAASATTTCPEILGDLEATFDPHDPDSIAGCLAGILHSPNTIARLIARSRRRAAAYTWKQVAEYSIDAYERVAAGIPAGRNRSSSIRALGVLRSRGRRPRLAFAIPWPAEGSEIADYNLRLATELCRRIDVDIIVEDPVREYTSPQEEGVRLIDHRDFERLCAVRIYDRILYCVQNSRFTHHVFELLKRYRGAVVFHDVQLLTGFYSWYAELDCPEDPDRALADRIHAMYGDRLPAHAIQDRMAAASWHEPLGIYMTREIQRFADRCFVHSRFARDVLVLERNPLDRPVPVSILPFGMPQAAPVGRGRAASRPLIVSIGCFHGTTAIAGLIQAFGLLSADVPTARLIVLGPGYAAESERWHRYTNVHAPNATIEFPGAVSKERSVELLETADVAVHLQPVSNGEASPAVAECLARGLPTIVPDLGWTGELPSDVVEKVSVGAQPDQLKDRMWTLISDQNRRAAMSAAALEHARRNCLARVADAYSDALALW